MKRKDKSIKQYQNYTTMRQKLKYIKASNKKLIEENFKLITYINELLEENKKVKMPWWKKVLKW